MGFGGESRRGGTARGHEHDVPRRWWTYCGRFPRRLNDRNSGFTQNLAIGAAPALPYPLRPLREAETKNQYQAVWPTESWDWAGWLSAGILTFSRMAASTRSTSVW